MLSGVETSLTISASHSMRNFFVYIITNKHQSTLYVGITNNLERRLWEHRNQTVKGFSSRYNLSFLLYYEVYPDPLSAIAREKQIKGWRREKKTNLIEKMNPRWMDLSEEWLR